jgi:hypothetical protein
MPLIDVQRALREYIVRSAEASVVSPNSERRDASVGVSVQVGGLVGGADPIRRLAIHRRHHRASLTGAIAGRFPATSWLLGEREFSLAAEEFVRQHPPVAPCIAEYGERFPSFVALRTSASVPYAGAFALLEWHVGTVSVAVTEAPVDIAALAASGDMDLHETHLTLQPGVRYLRADWPIDRLMELFVTDTAPERFSMDAQAVHLELRGARGEFHLSRLSQGRFAFRAALAAGASTDDAVEAALAHDPALDANDEVVALLREGLVTEVSAPAATSVRFNESPFP